MPKEVRSLMAEMLWDNIEEESASFWISEQWKEEMDRRYRLYKEGSTKLFTWEQVTTAKQIELSRN